jgi:hypothetical protein
LPTDWGRVRCLCRNRCHLGAPKTPNPEHETPHPKSSTALVWPFAKRWPEQVSLKSGLKE